MINKRLINTGVAAPAPFDPLQNFETVTYTGNGSTQKITGYIRKGAAFNGSNSRIDIGDFFDFSTESFSISCWVNTASLSAEQDVFTQWSATSTNRGIIGRIKTDGTFTVIEGVGSSNNGATAPISTTSISTNTWVHLVYTRSGTEGTIFVNGVEEDRNALTNTINNSTEIFQIGIRESSLDPFNGKIDQVRIFNTALNPTQVGQLALEDYTDPKKSTTDYFGNGSGVALYELDDSADDTGGIVPTPSVATYQLNGDATDLTGNYNGTWSGTETYGTGVFGQAGVFNGSSFIQSNIDVFNTTTYSISFWFNVNGYKNATYTHWAFIINNDQHLVISEFPANTIKIVFSDFTVANEFYTITDPTAWHHVTVTRNGNSISIYVNGIFANTFSYGGLSQGTSFKIGTNHVNNAFFDGSIDQVRIYDKELSADNVNTLYNETLADSSTNLALDIYQQYNGTATNVNYLGMAFQPDFIWIKNRSTGSNHILQNTVAGINTPQYSDATYLGTADSVFGHVNSVSSNGFEVDDGGSTEVNANSLNHNFVAWCWKAGGAAVSAGGTNLTNRLVSANPDAGFSIMTYTGSASDGTIEHGLNAKPELWIFKNLSVAKSWFTLTNIIDGSVDYGFLNTSDSFNNAGQADATDTVLNVNLDGGSGLLNASGNNYVAYCFHSVAGYQKVGSYTGTGATGNVINVGFKPRFLMWKKTNGAVGWFLLDGVRNTTDVWSARLEAHISGAEAGPDSYTVTVSNTGFEMTGSFANWTGSNELNSTYIYLAIA